MSANSDMSSWGSLPRQSEASDDDGSTASSDFVKVENSDTVTYHPSHLKSAAASNDDDASGRNAPLQCLPLNDVKLVLHLKEPVSSDTEEDEEQDGPGGDASSGTSLDSFAFISNSHSSFEEINSDSMEKDKKAVDDQPNLSDPLSVNDLQCPGTSSCGLKKKTPERALTDSDSDNSDFVRLDPSMFEETHADLMHLSNISNESSAPSLSSSFRFIHRSGMVLGADEYIKRRFYRDADADSVSVQSDIDDRCESDISGVADDDMSGCSLGDLPIAAGNVVRSYKHNPNNGLNSILTTMALVFLFASIGIAFGHYIGTLSAARLRNQQIQKMQTLTDDYLICLQHKDVLEEKLYNDEVRTEANIWKENCEVLEQVRDSLIGHINVLKQQLEEKMETKNIQPCTTSERLTEQNIDVSPAGVDEETDRQSLSVQQQSATDLIIADLQNEVLALRSDKEALLIAETELRHHSQDRFQQQNEFSLEYTRLVNDLRHENDDLKETVVKLRYTEHPGNQNHLDTAVGEAEELSIPNKESLLQNVTLPSEHPEPETVIDSDQLQEIEMLKYQLTDAKEGLENAKGKAEMWQSLFQVEAQRAAKAEENMPGVLGCLHVMFPNITLDGIAMMSRDALDNMGQFINQQLVFISTLSEDERVKESLRSKWHDLQQLFDTPTVAGASSRAAAIYSDVRAMLHDKLHLFKTSTESGESAKVPLPTDSDSSPINNDDKNNNNNNNNMPRPESRFSRAINKTKETVEKLSIKINETWHQVKGLPSKIGNKFAPGITKRVENFADKLHSGWDKVNKKITSALSTSYSWVRQGRKKSKKQQRADKKYRRRYDDNDARKQYHGDPYWNSGPDDEFDNTFAQKNDANNFEHKPDHKQKQSEPHSDKKYKEFWGAVGFNPDDISHDGFFEGNDRKWRKHEKTMHRLYGRIQKLNDDILYDMDDDDIEDLYEDLEDIDDDLGSNVQPPSVKAWLSCQIRWWKSRFQRKHRNEDLIHGCGRQLMHWQMKSSCSLKCKGDQKECKHVINNSIICQQVLSGTVIETVAENDHNNRYNENNQNDVSLPDDVNATHTLDLGKHNENLTKNPKQKSNKKSDKKNGRRVQGREDGDKVEGPKWLYERAHDLDYRLHKTDWMYRRANQRDYHRKRPSDWYHRRVESRENKHHEFVGKR